MADFIIFNNGLMTENTMSGSDQRVLNWSRFFVKGGHRLHIFTSLMGAKRFQEITPNLYISGTGYRKSNLGILFVYISRAIKSCILQGAIKTDSPGVIYSSSDLIADAIPALYVKILRRQFKLVMGMHLIAPNPLKGFKNMYTGKIGLPSLPSIYYFVSQRIVICLLRRFASLVLVSNNADRMFLINKGFSPCRVLVTYGACDFDCVNRAAPYSEAFDAVFVGRFHVQKGFPDLLKIWQKVVLQFPGAKLIIMGEDITAGDISKLIREHGLEENIGFLGYVGGQAKYSYIKSAKVLLLPSYYESFGIVALEAMSCGVPVVAYDLPVFREIYAFGMLRCRIGDWEEMAGSYLDLLKDDTLRQRMSEEALSFSKKFSWENTAKDIINRLGL